MKQQLAAGIVSVAVIGGIGTGFAVHELRTQPASASTPTATASPTPKPKATTSAPAPVTPAAPAPAAAASSSPAPAAPALLPVSSMLITPGAVGPVSVGATQGQAAATGYFDTDVQSANCDTVDPLAWKQPYASTFDVFTQENGSIDSIGIGDPGPRTRSGLQISSTYGEVKQVLGEGSQPEEAGYGQTGLFVDDGSGWIGFLFDTTVDQVDDADRVSFIEVTRGRKPGLMRDGC